MSFKNERNTEMIDNPRISELTGIHHVKGEPKNANTYSNGSLVVDVENGKLYIVKGGAFVEIS